METPRAFAAVVCLSVACSSDFSAGAPEAAAGKPASANGGSAGKPIGSGAASGRSASAGRGTGGNGGSSTSAGGNGGSAASGGSGARGGSDATGGTDAAGGTDATGGTNTTGGTDAAGGTTTTGGADASGGTGGDVSGAGGTGGSGNQGAGGASNTGGGSTGGGGGTGGLAVGGVGGGLGAAGHASAGMPATAGTPGGGSGGMVGGCDNQLLENATFEAGPTPSWREESDIPGLEIITRFDDSELLMEGVAPYAGAYLAWLGGIPDNEWDHNDVIMRQDVAIPEDASSLTLSGAYLIQSDDDASGQYDVAYLEFETDAGTFWQAVGWTNQDTTSGWKTFTSTTNDLSGLGGQTVTFVAYSRTDPMGKTSFFLDNLRLEAECGR